MTVYGVTPTGFVAKPVEVIIAELEADQRANLDSSLNTSASGVLANLNAGFAQQCGALWELGQEIYDAHDPNSAEGIAADHNGALSGVTRLGNAKSKVTLRLSLDTGGSVNAGSVVSMLGAPSVRFVTLADVAVVAAGDITVDAEAEQEGPITAGAGTLTVIESAASGWLAVTNDAAATPGHLVERDEAYRLRRATDIAAEGGSTLEALVDAVRLLTGIITATALSNRTDATDGNGVPPHSFEIVVRGDTAADADIAAAIWANLPAGIQPYGSTTVTITDSAGNAQAVKFTRATPVKINAKYRATVNSKYVTGGLAATVEAATVDPENPCYLDVGAPVYLARVLAAGLQTVGVVNLSLDLARAPSVPATSVPAAVDATITMGPRELAYFDASTSWVIG